jgi:hypothetical protein
MNRIARLFVQLIVVCGATCSTIAFAGAQMLSSEDDFRSRFSATQKVGFTQFATSGFIPPYLQLGPVSVLLTQAGSSLVFDPSDVSFPFGFTSRFLSTGVKDGENNVVITFPIGTRGGGMRFASVYPVTVTVTSNDGQTVTELTSSSTVRFIGFIDTVGVRSIRVSSPPATNTPIVNIENIIVGATLALPSSSNPVASTIPVLSLPAVFALVFMLLGFGAVRLRGK